VSYCTAVANLTWLLSSRGNCSCWNILNWYFLNSKVWQLCCYQFLKICYTSEYNYFSVQTVYGKTFEWENFHGFHDFSLNREYIHRLFKYLIPFNLHTTWHYLSILKCKKIGLYLLSLNIEHDCSWSYWSSQWGGKGSDENRLNANLELLY